MHHMVTDRLIDSNSSSVVNNIHRHLIVRCMKTIEYVYAVEGNMFLPKHFHSNSPAHPPSWPWIESVIVWKMMNVRKDANEETSMTPECEERLEAITPNSRTAEPQSTS